MLCFSLCRETLKHQVNILDLHIAITNLHIQALNEETTHVFFAKRLHFNPEHSLNSKNGEKRSEQIYVRPSVRLSIKKLRSSFECLPTDGGDGGNIYIPNFISVK